MKVLVVSDLHFEFHWDGGRSFVNTLAEADVCICVGDLSSSKGLRDALILLLNKYAHVVYVFGNHEYYGSSIPVVKQQISDFVQQMSEMGAKDFGQLHVLDNSTCEIEGQRFVGTTLWFRDAPDNALLAHCMTDFSLIEGAHTQIYEENRTALQFLEKTVCSDDVVLTHHLPTEASIHPRWKGSNLNRFFLCDIEPLIRDRQPRFFFHGHTHSSCRYRIGQTLVVCNPFGYAEREENPNFNFELIMDL